MGKQYCINCGTLVPISANFCPSCGAPQYGPEARVFRASNPVIKMNAASVAIAGASEKLESNNKKTYKDIPKTKLCKNALWAFYLDYLVKTSILPLLFAIGFVFEPFLTGVSFMFYLIIIYISALIVFENFSYSTDDIGFQKNYGAVHKKQVTIPYQQIQNVNINRSLTDRIFGLCHVSIETAGNSAGAQTTAVTTSTATTAEGYLPGLTLDKAKYLHDLLLTRAQED